MDLPGICCTCCTLPHMCAIIASHNLTLTSHFKALYVHSYCQVYAQNASFQQILLLAHMVHAPSMSTLWLDW